jgi:hypothetical protein
LNNNNQKKSDRKSLLLGLLSTICLSAIFCTLWFSGIGRQKVPETSQKTLPSHSKVQKQTKSSESSHLSSSKTSHFSSKVTQSTTPSVTPPVSKVEESPVYVAPSAAPNQENLTQERTTTFYQATVGQFSRTSTISQEDAQNKAQEAYNQAQAQEEATQQEAERIKQSIQANEPNVQVNVIDGE